MRVINVSAGIYWIDIPEAGLYVLCGCPADSVKHLMKRGLIVTEDKNGALCETGPNAILLSEVPIQNERLSNLAEFPVLQNALPAGHDPSQSSQQYRNKTIAYRA